MTHYVEEMSNESDQSTILIVDDNPTNLRVLVDALKMSGFKTLVAASGEWAIQQVDRIRPDLILLDVLMPGVDGFETCRQLKAKEVSREIPIIFMTALSDTVDKLKGFEVGGVDYLTKPLHHEEVIARVSTHLTIRRLQQQLKDQNEQMHQEIIERKRAEDALQQLNEELEVRVQQRTAELQEAVETLKKTQDQLIQSEKMALLISLVAGVAHEINTPVGVGLTAASHLIEKTQDFEQLYQQGQMKRSGLETYLKTATEASQLILKNLQLAAERTQSFKEIAVDQASGEKRTFNLKAYIDEVLLSLRPKLKKTRYTVTVTCPDDIDLESYPGAFSQILSNLVLNSLIHGFETQEEGEILLNVERQDEALILTYHDNGKGMEAGHVEKIFDAFFTTKRGQGGSGLGMNIVYNLVTKKLQGQITCESELDVGTTFTIQLPLDEGSDVSKA